MSQDHFPQAAAHITRVVHRRPSVSSAMGGVRASPALHPGAVTGAPHRPQGRLPKSLCLAPPSRCLLRSFRWHRPGCVPPLEIAEFEQRVLNGHGPAQVGFGFMHTSFLASPFVRGVHPAVDLVPSHCGSRAPEGCRRPPRCPDPNGRRNRSSNIERPNKKGNEHRTSNIERPTSNEEAKLPPEATIRTEAIAPTLR